MNCGEAWHGSMLPSSSLAASLLLCDQASASLALSASTSASTSAAGEEQTLAQCTLVKIFFFLFQVLAQISPPYYSASRMH